MMLVPNDAIHNKSALVQVIAWRCIGHKALPDLMMTEITDAYMRHLSSMFLISSVSQFS